MKEIVERLINEGKTIATMESCTGGAIVNEITNIEGASGILKFSAVTYSNEYKIKMGVDGDVIDKYTVYSMETAEEMSRNISLFANADYGVGITGQLNRYDPHNPVNENNVVYISIYDRENDKFINEEIRVEDISREKNKNLVINKIIILLEKILKNGI